MKMYKHGRSSDQASPRGMMGGRGGRRGEGRAREGRFGGPFGHFGSWGGEGSGEDGPRGRGFGGGRRGPRGRMFAGGELRLLLLRLVAGESRHGYELIKAIEELTDGSYAPSPGVVYPTLSLLVDEGVITQAADDASARKAFVVSEAGLAELATRKDEADALIARLTALAENEKRGDAPPVRRAIGNLFTALRHRAMAGGFADEAAHQIAEILDEAARKIERL